MADLRGCDRSMTACQRVREENKRLRAMAAKLDVQCATLADQVHQMKKLLPRCERAVRLCATTANEPSLDEMKRLTHDLAPWREQ